MNRIQIGGYIRITKKEAARRYNAGEVIRLTACKLSPVSPWGCYSDAQRENYTQVGGDGFNTTIAATVNLKPWLMLSCITTAPTKRANTPAYWKKEA